MHLKMLETKKGKPSDSSVRLYEKGKTYEVACTSLSTVFLKNGWAKEVADSSVKITPAQGKDFDPAEVTNVTDLSQLSIDKLRATAKYLKVKGWHNAKADTLKAAIGEALFNVESITLDASTLKSLTTEQLNAVAEAYQVDIEGKSAEDLISELLDN